MKKLVFALPFLALAACGTTPPAPTFAPLNYSYLPPILLKVSQINVVDSYVPTPSQVQTAAMDPVPPAVALMTMLKQRLQPAGQPGTGTVTVQNVYVDNVNGTLMGQMVVDVNLASADGLKTGFTEAGVSATETAPDSDNPDDMRAALYELTKRLMTNMNVQLQYQIQKNMPSWISWTNNGAAAAPVTGLSTGGSAVQAAPLAAPAGMPVVNTVGASASGQAIPPTGGAASQPQVPQQTDGNVNAAVPSYLPGTGPTTLTNGQN